MGLQKPLKSRAWNNVEIQAYCLLCKTLIVYLIFILDYRLCVSNLITKYLKYLHFFLSL